ncbi:MAG: DUF4174 domain-containing protein [Pseudomonadota bacterium]
MSTGATQRAPLLRGLVTGVLVWTALTTLAIAEPLAQYAWEARPVVVFAKDAGDRDLGRQLAELAAYPAERVSRQMPVIAVIGARVSVDGVPSKIDATALRRHYGVSQAAFAVLLIGKDTGVKLRRETSVSAATLFALIDTMPMRQRERDEEP